LNRTPLASTILEPPAVGRPVMGHTGKASGKSATEAMINIFFWIGRIVRRIVDPNSSVVGPATRFPANVLGFC